MGLPSTASQLELWKNWPDIVWKGANGQLVEPIPIAKYSAEAILTAKRDPNEWAIFDIPQNLKQWCKVASCFEYEGSVCFPSEDSNSGDDVGWLVAVADSPGEVIKIINRQADDLPDGPLDVLLYDPKTGVKVWTGWFDGSAWSEGLLPADKKA